jgi:hypothetical protein
MYKLIVTIRKPPPVLLPIGDGKSSNFNLLIFFLLKCELLRLGVEILRHDDELVNSPKLNCLFEIPIRIVYLLIPFLYTYAISLNIMAMF